MHASATEYSWNIDQIANTIKVTYADGYTLTLQANPITYVPNVKNVYQGTLVANPGEESLYFTVKTLQLD